MHSVPSALSPEELQTARQLIRTALLEDLAGQSDVTTTLLIPPEAQGNVEIVARQHGILCGGDIARFVLDEIDPAVICVSLISDGSQLEPGTRIAQLQGSVRSLLTAERTILNFQTLLSGVATLTGQYVAAIAGTSAHILDTRKTLPGLRSLQKYAVRCGGGTNHRLGLYDAVLVKDNHLAWTTEHQRSLPEAVRQLRNAAPTGMVIEFEVDSLDQLRDLLPAQPDIVLLDNMTLDQLTKSVDLRSRLAPQVLLEASGGVNLSTVAAIAATGVDRISIGALTHSAPALDIGFDWSRQ